MLTCFFFQRTEISQHADEAEKAAVYPRSTTREKPFCGTPKMTFCGAWWVRHRIVATKMWILWRTTWCAIEIPIFCGAPWSMRHRNMFSSAFSGGAPQKMVRHRTKNHAPQNCCTCIWNLLLPAVQIQVYYRNTCILQYLYRYNRKIIYFDRYMKTNTLLCHHITYIPR